LKAYPKGGIKVSISPFIPKPHTPFESVEFSPVDELHEKIKRIRRMKKRRVEIKYQSPEVAFIEAFLSKADDKVFPAIESVYREGGRFEEWREGFDFSRWQAAFEISGVDPRKYLKPSETYPWDFVDSGVTKGFLKKEFVNAQDGVVTENCYYKDCTQCGACDGKIDKYYQRDEKYLSYGRYPKRKSQPVLYRVRYSIGENFRFASHLDIARTIYRSLRRSDLPVQFTQGFSPIPKVSFCPPKSVGQIAKGDFFDFYLESEYFGNISVELNARFPSGIRILEVRAIPLKTPPLSNSINLIYYEVSISEDDIKRPLDFVNNKKVYIETKSGKKNISDGVASISLEDSALTCGLNFGAKTVNVYELLSYLTDRPVALAKTYKITRTKMFINKDGVAYSPMEAK
jgi:radical SAM-linked protein